MQPIPKLLSVSDHSRDSISMTYVYPVISRRASGVSIGINLNPNNACNWRCIYCQVPNLKRGSAPIIDLVKLEQELRTFLHELFYGRFMLDKVPQLARRINDIALSGNGEPTSAKEFEQVISLIELVKHDFPLPEELKLVLITNGSLVDRAHVQRGLSHMAKLNGEIWFKLDSVTQEGRMRINNTRMSLKKMHANLKIAASLCPTWVQTCVLEIDGKPPAEREINAYLEFLYKVKQEGISLQGILLYGLARPSLQPEAPRLSKVSVAWIESFAARIKTLGLAVKVHA
ncbi:Wyosine [tRNA(Phe)-imidazoG37] synthetase, radical SAM superfamily [Nitrosomonas communis]|uniref:Wyosine [tRNA(Phe)-imidazoG37] synthetase, radical SAM superfamily n=2 Tax=Nitrosomonas communis TaxID=44574 RepID=A0A1I4R705_9PROT|nr:Wyosine [tRNA(Phe)-imidazoG37] synthetase, radical SAM superfamily [Nitrosomonas communis]